MNKRLISLFEVCMVVFVATLIIWLLEAYLNWFEFRAWLAKAFLVPVMLLAIIPPRRSLKAYGLVPRNPQFTLKWIIIVVACFLLPATISITASVALGISNIAKISPQTIVLNTIWYIVFTGLIEEAYFRGYVQSRLEYAFGKKWNRLIFKSWRVCFGWGLIMASMIFGLVHIVEYCNPFISKCNLVWWVFIHILGAFAFGCLAGALREVSGDIYVPAFLHGSINTANAFLLTYTDWRFLNIAMFSSFFIFFYILERFFREAENTGITCISK